MHILPIDPLSFTPALDAPNGLRADTESTGKLRAWKLGLQYENHVIISKLSVSGSITKNRIVSPLLHHVAGVVFSCAKKQMIWTAALRVIAVMAYKHARRNLSKCLLKHNAMSQVPPARYFYGTVSIFIEVSSPFPASRDSLYFFPKALFRWIFGAPIFSCFRASHGFI